MPRHLLMLSIFYVIYKRLDPRISIAAGIFLQLSLYLYKIYQILGYL